MNSLTANNKTLLFDFWGDDVLAKMERYPLDRHTPPLFDDKILLTAIDFILRGHGRFKS
jgi:hypothetical protein